MKTESATKQFQLPIVDSLHCGDTLLEWFASDQKDKDELRKTIHKLQDLFHSATQNSNLDEDTLIDRLFSVPDIEYEKRENQTKFQFAEGKTCTIRTTEVIDNTTGQEQDVQNREFGSAEKTYVDKPDFAQATLHCCDEFLTWILKRIDEPNLYGISQVSFPCEVIFNFVLDLSSTGLISELCKNPTSREKQAFTLPMFVDIENLAFFNCIPNNPTKEIMAIFAIRQMLESWFMRIVGFRGVVPLENFEIRSGRFQRIIEQGFETAFRFPPGNANVSFKSIQRIYQWTQASIHWAYSTNVWLVWKAVTYCERLFGATIELSALEKYRNEVIKLCLEAAKYVKERKNTNNPKDRPPQRIILFREPDIKVSNNGKLIHRFDVDGIGFTLLEKNVIIKK